ncbi:uncharacterized protein LOC111696046, partial [Eurytemora carolleeae]|uniref:uncharacterized protein LOC111696046 n=1 Tax=Eurytemora carolleeae TaxID=1294199 RepID=UPI000C76B57B
MAEILQDPPPLPSISHQDIQEATQVDTELGLTPDQIQQFHQLGASTPNFLHPVLHYQLQGTWETPSGKFVNYIILKDSLESKVDISRIYFNIEDINKCRGFNLDLSGVNDRYHLNLLNLILEFPHSELVMDLFKEFLNSLNPLASTEVTEPLSTPRIIEGKGPKIQLKLESFHLERDLVEDEGENDR